MEQSVEPGIYRHFKGGIYEVKGVAFHSETEEPLVIYQPLQSEPRLWAQPVVMWKETVLQDGLEQHRFRFLADDLEELDSKPRFRMIEDVVDAMEICGTELFCDTDNQYFVDRESNRVVSLESLQPLDDEVFDEKRYILIEKDDGSNYEMMEDFVEGSIYTIRDREKLREAINGRGAFKRFRSTIQRLGIEDAWYAYRDMRMRCAARVFCQDNGLSWGLELLAP